MTSFADVFALQYVSVTVCFGDRGLAVKASLIESHSLLVFVNNDKIFVYFYMIVRAGTRKKL